MPAPDHFGVQPAGRPGDGGPQADPLGLADDAGTWVQIANREELRGQFRADGAWFPIAIKANVAARGMELSAASPALSGRRAGADSGVVAALRARGAVVAGVANMHELAFGITSNNAYTGPVRNPADPGRSAGGSSGGCAAAVARGHVRAAVGTDTGGSVAIPAALCGVTGFRPTTGRWPTDGLVGLSWTRDTAGVFTLDVASAAEFDQWITGVPHPPPAADWKPAGAPPRTGPTNATGPSETDGCHLRLGMPAEFHADLDPATARAMRRARASLEQVATLEEVDLGPVLADLPECEWLTVAYESRRQLAGAVAEHRQVSPGRAWELLQESAASPDVRQVLEAIEADPVSDDQYAWAQHRIWQAREQYRRAMAIAGLDGLVFPTTPLPAQPIGCDGVLTHNGRAQPIFPLMTRNTMPGTLLRAPMLTLPITHGGTPSQGLATLPTGLTIQGVAFDDARILAAGRLIEQALAPQCG